MEQRITDKTSTRLFIIEDEGERHITLPNNELLRTGLTRQGINFTEDANRVLIDLATQEIGIDENGLLNIEGYPETFKVDTIKITRE